MRRFVKELKLGLNKSAACRLCILIAAAAGGCNAPQEYGGPSFCEAHAPMPGYVREVLETAGGCEAWTAVERLKGECLVSYYGPQGTRYITPQTHEILPASGTIRISGREPEGPVRWMLSEEGLRVLDGRSVDGPHGFPSAHCKAYFARSILQIFTAGLRLAEESEFFIESSAPVKLEGKWYNSFERLEGAQGGKEDTVSTYYQAKSTGIVDVIELAADGEIAKAWVKGYDYVRIRPAEVVVPSKLEIFLDGRRVAELDYYDLECF
jgi:hypothetical protein